MEFTHERSHGSITRRVNIIDGPVMPHPNSSIGRRIRVTAASIRFELDRNGNGWTANSWTQFKVSGVVLRKDGTEGKETWNGTVHYNWDKTEAYDWLRQLTDAMRPEGVPVLPFRLSGLENDDLEAGA